mmetsp:Transcript_14811/g.42561  ORF Transcript_14811/g.42561 Transcript_14811/m.42561 type:complete len:218 (+) Transcript_14811:286-939(+)
MQGEGIHSFCDGQAGYLPKPIHTTVMIMATPDRHPSVTEKHQEDGLSHQLVLSVRTSPPRCIQANKPLHGANLSGCTEEDQCAQPPHAVTGRYKVQVTASQYLHTSLSHLTRAKNQSLTLHRISSLYGWSGRIIYMPAYTQPTTQPASPPHTMNAPSRPLFTFSLSFFLAEKAGHSFHKGMFGLHADGCLAEVELEEGLGQLGVDHSAGGLATDEDV